MPALPLFSDVDLLGHGKRTPRFFVDDLPQSIDSRK
jgi:hypothetical protein